MCYIKNKLFLLCCLIGFGLNAQTSISGKVMTPEDAPLANVTITISNANFTETTMTDAAGNYSFTNLSETEGITYDVVMGGQNNNPLNGLSTFDYVLAARHILGITPFAEPHQYLAMDINNSGNITAFDLVQLRQLILGITATFSNNTAWRFAEKTALASLTFSQANDPEYQGELNANPTLTSGGNTVIDFIGIKVGDANGSVVTN